MDWGRPVIVHVGWLCIGAADARAAPVLGSMDVGAAGQTVTSAAAILHPDYATARTAAADKLYHQPSWECALHELQLARRFH